MTKEYIEFRDGGYWIKETRISLDSVVYAFQRGSSPESIQRSFPLLTLEEVYGTIAYYLAHQSEIDAYLKEEEKKCEADRQAAREADPEFYRRFAELKKEREANVQ
jgi:uncharacterized protein (DUF433 family)